MFASSVLRITLLHYTVMQNVLTQVSSLAGSMDYYCFPANHSIEALHYSKVAVACPFR